MILEVDIGNTRIKWRCLDRNRVVGEGVLNQELQEGWVSLIEREYLPKLVRVACVGKQEQMDWIAGLATRWGAELFMAKTAPFAHGVRCGYDQPTTMGVDRWLAVIAAYHQLRQACVVVDAGSAITVDLIDSKGLHLGGYIVPGFSMMHQSLFQGTSKVKTVVGKTASTSPGSSTQQAVSHGCLLMTKALVESAVKELEVLNTSVKTVVTGGDAHLLVGVLGGEVELIPDLVLDGLEISSL